MDARRYGKVNTCIAVAVIWMPLVLVHSVHQKLIGVKQTTIPYAKGKYFGAELKAKANGPDEGWVSYAWTNAKTKAIEATCTNLKTTTKDGKKVIVCAGIGGISVQDCK